MLVAFSELLFFWQELAVRRAHAKWSRLRKKVLISQTENYSIVRRVHAK